MVLRNLHPSVETQDIKNELKDKGHNVLRINNIFQRTSKKPLPLFFLELENKDNKEIYKIEHLLYTKVTFEPPYKKRNIPQCLSLNSMVIRKTSYKNLRCVKYVENYITQNCPRKSKNSEVICANCSENYPANYKGCVVFKQLRQKMFPALRKKSVDRKTQTSQVRSSTSQPENVVQPGTTYAQRVNGTPQDHQDHQEDKPTDVVPNNQHTSKLEEMFTRLLAKMDSMFITLISLLTVIDI